MSALNFKLKLSAKARKDLSGILTYTLNSWGRGQMDTYQALLNNAFAVLLNNPNIGRSYDRCRVYTVGSHRIFYRVTEQTIYVIRILHERMNASQHLQNLQ